MAMVSPMIGYHSYHIHVFYPHIPKISPLELVGSPYIAIINLPLAYERVTSSKFQRTVQRMTFVNTRALRWEKNTFFFLG